MDAENRTVRTMHIADISKLNNHFNSYLPDSSSPLYRTIFTEQSVRNLFIDRRVESLSYRQHAVRLCLKDYV